MQRTTLIRLNNIETIIKLLNNKIRKSLKKGRNKLKNLKNKCLNKINISKNFKARYKAYNNLSSI